MQQRTELPLFRDISFNPNLIEQYLPMEPLHPAVFDMFCEDGWAYWSDSIFRRNIWEWRGIPCRVILLRIDLNRFEYSKSQRRCLRKNRDLKTVVKPIRITAQHEELFRRHAQRFEYNKPQTIYGFFSLFSHMQPCYGMEFDVFQGDKMIAASFAHLGYRSMASNYCVYDPAGNTERSLGMFTMLLEIEYARRIGKPYYYPGFVYDLPSEFDYKLNFGALEYFDWWGNWYPLDRLAVRNWRNEWPGKVSVEDLQKSTLPGMDGAGRN